LQFGNGALQFQTLSGLTAGSTYSFAPQLSLDSSGNLGIGTSSPVYQTQIYGSGQTTAALTDAGNKGGSLLLNTPTVSAGDGGALLLGAGGSGAKPFAAVKGLLSDGGGNTTGAIAFSTRNAIGDTALTERMRLNSSGNLGLGVTPSAWGVGYKAFQNGVFCLASDGTNNDLTANRFINSGGTSTYIANGFASMLRQDGGTFKFFTAPSGTAGNAISFTQAMTLDASGNLLVGTTTSTARLTTASAGAEGAVEVSFLSGGCQFFVNSVGGGNAAATVQRIGRNSGTTRSINAGGTINASGADYAEYMTKAGDFTVAKGDVVGIDAQGKLTNVFSNAVSFCVKSTDPSYVGGDTWGTDFENDPDGLEAARQTVDRIAFAGQVPVNVIGATAGQYIIPVNDNGAIKGDAVSSPTFEQYQQAVGKVIAIETDGRARIIVKVA